MAWRRSNSFQSLWLSVQTNGHFEETAAHGRGGESGNLSDPGPLVTQLLPRPPTRPAIHPPPHPSSHHLIHPFSQPLTCLSTHSLTHPSIHTSIHPSSHFLTHSFLHSSTSPGKHLFESTSYPFGENYSQQFPEEQESHIFPFSPQPQATSPRFSMALRGEEPTEARLGGLGGDSQFQY